MKRLFEKRCPHCADKVPARLVLGLQSAEFDCPHCKTRLRSGHPGMQLLGLALGSLFIAAPVVQSSHNPLWWLVLIPGIVFYLLWSYVFVVPRRV